MLEWMSNGSPGVRCILVVMGRVEGVVEVEVW